MQNFDEASQRWFALGRAKWNEGLAWCNENQDYFIDALRVYLGLALFIKGLYFVRHINQLHELIGTNGMMMGPAFLAHVVPSIHLVGGLTLAAGLFTRFSALIQIPILFGAVFIVHWREGLFSGSASLELAGLVLICLIAIAGYGPGRLSADYYMQTFQHDEDERKPSFA
jgi:putative oxidoreductase